MSDSSEENIPKEAIGEDWCFICYEGGELRICDYKGCSKSYHTYCVDKDESFLEDESEWFCNSHICCHCHKSSDVHCLCCPKSVCWHCIGFIDVVEIKRGKGFCSKCLTLALMIEENSSFDSDGNYVDFNDLRTDEGLFKEYWEIINKEEGVTLETLHSADVKMQKGNIKKKGNRRRKRNKKQSSPDLEKHDNCEETELSDYDVSYYAKRKSNQKLERSRNPTSAKERKVRKREFIGWGSMDLINFLQSIDVDVSESLSQRNVTSIVSQYIRDKKLFHPDKKKKVVCDANLQTLFSRKTLNKHKLSQYLEGHLAENQESSEEDEILDVSEDENSCVVKRQRENNEYRKVSEGEKSLIRKRQRKTSEDKKFEEPPRFSRPQCHYASICPVNINLIYLKRTLVQKLLEVPDTFGRKLTGSFVKVKSDPNDYLQRKPHQLMQVTGTTNDTSDENNMKVLLMVSGSTKPISINNLLESDITEDDCERLRQRIKSGLLKQPTIIELKEKAIDLHEERMKHWIARELKLLQNRIDQANEKGWRKELYEYWEAQEKLQASKERLLQNVPDVIAADLSELDYMPEGIIDDKAEDDSSPNSGSEKKEQKNKAYRSSPCTPSIKQNPFKKLEQNTGKSLQAMGVHIVDLTGDVNGKNRDAMGVHIVDLTSDVNGKNRDAATQTQELEGTKSPTYNCITPDDQKKGPFSLEIRN